MNIFVYMSADSKYISFRMLREKDFQIFLSIAMYTHIRVEHNSYQILYIQINQFVIFSIYT